MPVPHLDQAYSTSSLSPLMVGQWTGGWSVVLRITRSNWVCFHFPSNSAIDLQKDTCLVLLSLLRIKLLPNSYSMSCQSGQGRAGQEYRPPNIVIMIIIAAALAIFTRSRPT